MMTINKNSVARTMRGAVALALACALSWMASAQTEGQTEEPADDSAWFKAVMDKIDRQGDVVVAVDGKAVMGAVAQAAPAIAGAGVLPLGPMAPMVGDAANVNGLLDALGVSGIEGVAYSASRLNEGGNNSQPAFREKAVIHVPNGRHGLLKTGLKDDTPFNLLDMAPANSYLVVDLNYSGAWINTLMMKITAAAPNQFKVDHAAIEKEFDPNSTQGAFNGFGMIVAPDPIVAIEGPEVIRPETLNVAWILKGAQEGFLQLLAISVQTSGQKDWEVRPKVYSGHQGFMATHRYAKKWQMGAVHTGSEIIVSNNDAFIALLLANRKGQRNFRNQNPALREAFGDREAKGIAFFMMDSISNEAVEPIVKTLDTIMRWPLFGGEVAPTDELNRLVSQMGGRVMMVTATPASIEYESVAKSSRLHMNMLAAGGVLPILDTAVLWAPFAFVDGAMALGQ